MFFQGKRSGALPQKSLILPSLIQLQISHSLDEQKIMHSNMNSSTSAIVHIHKWPKIFNLSFEL